MSEKQILDKLDCIQKEQRKSSAGTNVGFGFSIATYAAGITAVSTGQLTRIIFAILAGLGIIWFVWNLRTSVRLDRE